MKKILVIGASGFVGGYLTRQLLAEGYRVRCLARNPDKVKELAERGCEIVKGDLSDPSSVQHALESMDAVYISIHTLAPQHKDTANLGFMDIEMNGLKNIVEGCKMHHVQRLIYVTSLGIAADNKDAWTSGRWKTQNYLLNSGLDVTVIQPGMIVGIGGQGFNMVLANAKKNTAFVVGNGRNKFRCIAIEDLVYNLIGVLTEPTAYGQCYEVGSDDILTGDQLIDVAAEVTGHRHPRKIHISLSLLRFAAPLIELIAKTPKGSMKGALDGLGADMIGNPSAIRKLLPRKPISYKQAVEKALKVYQKVVDLQYGKSQPYQLKTISDFHRLLGAPAPVHPLISVIKIEPFEHIPKSIPGNVINGFYNISLKKGFKSPVKFKYGQQAYDFDEGVLSFMSPGQISGFDPQKYASPEQSGWLLLFHPDLLWNTPLAKKINQYGFFDYAVNEALFLSDKEEVALNQIVGNISQEYHNNLDKFSHDIIITQLESLLSYSERFYQRQFMTRRKTGYQILDRLNEKLVNYFDDVNAMKNGLPTVGYLAEQLNVSPDYLSGLLKTLTGLTTQQHIHEKLIEKAKQQLSTTTLSVGEIAYQLGFEHSQSFSKLFKSKTHQSPLAFRKAFN